MKKILFITKHHLSKITGGSEEQCWLLSTEFARRGWEVHYASETNRILEPILSDGVILHGLPENPSYLWGNRKHLRQLMRELRPDVVYNLGFDMYTAHAITEAPHEACTIWASANSGDGFIWPRLREMKRVTPLPLFLKRFPIHFFIFASAKRAVRSAGIALVQRTDQVEEFRRYGIEASLFRNVQPPVPESEVQKHSGKPIVLWAASIKEWKRPEKFIELAARCKDLDADFLMIGAVQDISYRDMLASATKEIPRLRWEGAIPISRVREFFSKAHIFVNTSIKLEGFANSFIHAWLHGVPVVTLGVDPEGLLSQSGLGIALQSIDEMEQGVRQLISNPDRRREIGKRARDFAMQEFDFGRNVDFLESLIRKYGVEPSQR